MKTNLLLIVVSGLRMCVRMYYVGAHLSSMRAYSHVTMVASKLEAKLKR